MLWTLTRARGGSLRIAAIGAELLIIGVLLLLNGVLAMSELAVVSSRRARLQQLAESGSRGARVALDLSQAPNRFLSTVQVGITMVGILAGAFGGATLTTYLSDLLSQVAFLDEYSEPLGFTVVVLSITYLSLVVGELVPKRIALRNPEGVASIVARPMRALSVAAAPFVTVLDISTEAVLRLLHIRALEEAPVSEEEIKILVEQGTAAGVFQPGEQELVASVFRLADRTAGDIATPRVRVVWLDVGDPPEASRRTMVQSPHHYFPVCEGDLDRVIGIVSVKDAWSRIADGVAVELQTIIKEPLFIPEHLPALSALERFRESSMPVALVIDEYGGVVGLFSMNDVLESLVGQLASSEGPTDHSAMQRADGSWLVDGMLAIDELEDRLRVDLSRAEGGDYQTVGGFVMARLGRIAVEGDTFDSSGIRFEVVDMDGNRVDKVLVDVSQLGARN